MKNIILNEEKYAENIIEKHFIGGNPAEALGIVSRYYASLGYSKKVIIKKLEEFLLRSDSNINLVNYQTMIEKFAKSANKFPLTKIDQITITKSELEKIALLNGKQLQRLMFTILCLAKFRNAKNSQNNNWTNTENKDIFTLANIKTSFERQGLLINTLYTEGYIKYSKVVDNLNLNVQIIDDNSIPVLHITDFRNLGNQYLKYKGEPYFECQYCGAVVKQRANNQKYCLTCGVVVNRQETYKRKYPNQHDINTIS